MEPTPELLAQLDREDIEQARRMTPAQRFWAGGELFDEACRWTLAGIRHQHPGISEGEALAELRRRLAVAQEMEDRS
jgi:hypothetical protein